MVVEWVDADNNVLGYTVAYGRNDSFAAATRTEVTNAGPTAGVKYDEPFAVADGGGMFLCERYPQVGGNGQKWYFRLRVSGGDLPAGSAYTVYLPYSYLGISESDAQKLMQSGKTARVDHYADGDAMAPTTIDGTYTEWGICFKTDSFSPFFISAEGTSSGDGETGETGGTGSTSGATGNGGHSGSSANASPTTWDAGIALYVAMAAGSAAGMAWIGNKKRR